MPWVGTTTWSLDDLAFSSDRACMRLASHKETSMPSRALKTTKKPTKAASPTTAKLPAAPLALTPGTVLRKTDRAGKVRCECTVDTEGFRYKGKLYSSLPGSA